MSDGKLKLKHFSVIFSTAGILILYFISTLTQPITVEIQNISNYEGKQVTVEGCVTEYFETTQGSQIITIEENNYTLTIFLEGTTELDYGDIIKATGEVQKYGGEWELVVNDENFVKIIKKWKENTLFIWQLGSNPQKYKNLNVNITGYIDYVYDDYFYITDSDNKYSLVVSSGLGHNISLNMGQRVKVAGKFTFDETDFRYKITLLGSSHGIWLLGGDS
jgi:hypothetical protein